MQKALGPWLAVLLLMLLANCTGGQKLRTADTFFALDTVIDITVYGESEEKNRARLTHMRDLTRQYEELWSATIPTSDIGRVNSSDTGAEVDHATAALVREALAFSASTDGVFDVSIGPVSGLWTFGEEPGAIPPGGMIAEQLTHTGYHLFSVRGNRVDKSDPYAKLDLGGAAKGYIADRLADALREQGVESALFNLGGNILSVGERGDGEPWTVGLEKPFGADGEWICRIRSRDSAIVTSGISQRYFRQDGTLYHHLLDTATGYPVQNDLYSVTVLCAAGETADPSWQAELLSTTCFLLGLEQGMAYLETIPFAQGIFVDSNYGIHTTQGLEAAYDIQWEEAPLSR